jgi:flagellin-like hook-associated protein FlgL
MRNNLVSLQGTNDLLNRTQERLATGKKINSALDNPTSFFAAKSLNQSASDLAAVKDTMGQAIQTISAANNGISAIQTLIDSAKGIAQTALATSDTTVRASYATQYNAIRTQIDRLAADSGYRGTDLLANTGAPVALTISFGGTSSMVVTGFDASTTGLALTAAASSWANTTSITADVTLMDSATSTLRTNSTNLSSNLAIINARDQFTTSMVNTFTQGADKLTLADMNEEGANMLMLQTRQSLGVTALSLSSQAAQAVLRLF